MKKKLLAIMLAVVLVVSAVAVLASCGNEYTVTFTEASGRNYFTLKTSGGKLSKADVEAETAKLSNGNKVFLGWYANADYVEENWIFSNEIDYDKVYTADTTYYANWASTGLAQGYTLIGVIGGNKIWSPGEEPEEWMLQQDTSKPWLYRATVDVQAGDALKVKEKSNEWNNVCNLGYEGLKEVILGDGVELPDGVTKDIVIYGHDGDNVFISGHVVTMNITVEFDASITKFSITINDGEFLEEEPVYDYILVGTLAEGEWDASSTNEKVIFTDSGDGNVFTLEYTFRKGDKWQVTLNNNAWTWQLGSSSLTVQAGSSVQAGDIVDLFTGDGDIEVAKACSVTITLNVANSTLTVVVNEILE